MLFWQHTRNEMVCPGHTNKWLVTDELGHESAFNGCYNSDCLDIERINTLHTNTAKSIRANDSMFLNILSQFIQTRVKEKRRLYQGAEAGVLEPSREGVELGPEHEVGMQVVVWS